MYVYTRGEKLFTIYYVVVLVCTEILTACVKIWHLKINPNTVIALASGYAGIYIKGRGHHHRHLS